MEHLNISKLEAIAFGDGGNDIEMLQYVGLGVAMGNGGEELKRRADFVTTKASEGGILCLKEVANYLKLIVSQCEKSCFNNGFC